MPLSLDNIIQSKSGSFEGASGTVSLDTATSGGTTLIICAASGGTGFTPGTDLIYNLTLAFDGAAWTKASGNQNSPGRSHPFIFVRGNNASGQSSWTLNCSNGGNLVTWFVMEVSGIGIDPNPSFTINAGELSVSSSVASTRSTGTTSDRSSYDSLSLAIFAGAQASSTIPAWSGYDNGFTELVELGTNNASRSLDMAVGYKFHLDLGTAECTAAVSPDSYSVATIVTLFADTSKRAPNLCAFTGFEYGTTSGWATAADVPVSLVDEANGSPAIVTTSPRSGTYCLELSASAAVENIGYLYTIGASPGQLQGLGPDSQTALVGRIHFYFPTSLPSGDTVLAWDESTSSGVVIRYVSASQKIGVKVGTGSEVLSDATVAADKWIGLDFRHSPWATTHTCDWWLDYDSLDSAAGPVEQTQASGSGSLANITRFALGWSASTTATVRYDDIALSRVWGAYPLGDTRCKLLKVDPAGTPTVSGTSTNFEVYTSNGTGAAFTAAGARGAVDEVPVVIGASSDGIMQVNIATSDYVEFPMETNPASADFVNRSVRMLLPGWAASGNPAIIKGELYDGDGTLLNATTLADHLFDSSVAIWLCYYPAPIGKNFYLLTQARLDGMVVRVGYSNDANPDVGFHAIYLELAYSPVETFRVSEAEGGDFTLDVKQDSFGAAVTALVITSNHASRGCTGTATINGTDYTHHVNAQESYTWQIGASSISEVTSYGLTPDF